MPAQPKAKRICVPVTEMQYWPDYKYEKDHSLKEILTSMCECGLTSALCSRMRSENSNRNDMKHGFLLLNEKRLPYVFMTLESENQER